jgi:hypothetical protein
MGRYGAINDWMTIIENADSLTCHEGHRSAQFSVVSEMDCRIDIVAERRVNCSSQ